MQHATKQLQPTASRAAAHHTSNAGVSMPAVHPIQRVAIKRSDDKELNPRLSGTNWANLTPAQQTKATRISQDPYTAYYFKDYNHLFDYILNGKAPTKIKYKSHKQGGGTSKNPFKIKEDHYFDQYDDSGVGGLGIISQPSKLTFGAQGFKYKPTLSHESNWANYVELHYDATFNKLKNLKKFESVIKTRLLTLYHEAIEQAEVLDNMIVEDTTQLPLKDENIAASGKIERRVNAMWNLVAKHTKTSRQTYPQAALPRWGQLNNGMGTSVKAFFYANNNQSLVPGSKADKSLFKPPWLHKLDFRIGNDNTSYYIEGHLLNDNLGGPAAAYNIVPLSNEANAIHLNLVEKYVKDKVLELRREQEIIKLGSPIRNPIDHILYDVKVEHGPWEDRPITQAWIDAFILINRIINNPPPPPVIAKKHSKPPKSKKTKTTHIYSGITTVKTFRDCLLNGDYAHHRVSGILMTDNNIWDQLQPFVNFVIPNYSDRANVNLDELKNRFDLISELFIDEEKYVPKKLICSYQTVRADKSIDDDSNVSNERIENQIGKIPIPGGYRGK